MCFHIVCFVCCSPFSFKLVQKVFVCGNSIFFFFIKHCILFKQKIFSFPKSIIVWFDIYSLLRAFSEEPLVSITCDSFVVSHFISLWRGYTSQKLKYVESFNGHLLVHCMLTASLMLLAYQKRYLINLHFNNTPLAPPYWVPLPPPSNFCATVSQHQLSLSSMQLSPCTISPHNIGSPSIVSPSSNYYLPPLSYTISSPPPSCIAISCAPILLHYLLLPSLATVSCHPIQYNCLAPPSIPTILHLCNLPPPSLHPISLSFSYHQHPCHLTLPSLTPIFSSCYLALPSLLLQCCPMTPSVISQ